MRKSYNYEIILYYFQTVLGNSLDPDLDSGDFRIRIRLKFLAGRGSGFNEYGSKTKIEVLIDFTVMHSEPCHKEVYCEHCCDW